MMHVALVIAAPTATTILASKGGMAASSEDLVARFTRLDRATAWEPIARVPVAFPTHHPQGFAAADDALFVATVEIIEPTERFPTPRNGYDRSPGKGHGHLLKMSRDGRLLGQTALGEGDVYHPVGIDFDGRWLWVPVAEYRPNSRSIVYRVDQATLEAVEVLRADDHIGGIVRDPDANTLHGVSWGSRRCARSTRHTTSTTRTAPMPAGTGCSALG
jgi:hypothetical protein